jgi:hypothetical protein
MSGPVPLLVMTRPFGLPGSTDAVPDAPPMSASSHGDGSEAGAGETLMRARRKSGARILTAPGRRVGMELSLFDSAGLQEVALL